MRMNFVAKNAANFIKLNAAFFIVEVEKGITAAQINSLLNKLSYSEEFELITVEGDSGSAMGLIDMRWFERKFNYDPDDIYLFVQNVIDRVYEQSDDNVYFLKEGPIYISCPDVY